MQETCARGRLRTGAALEVGTPHASEEEGVARERGRAVEQVRGALPGVAGCVPRDQPCRAEGDPVALDDGFEGMATAILSRQQELDAGPIGQLLRPRQMVGVDVGVDHRDQTPCAFAEQPDVDLGIDRGVDDDCIRL